MAKSKSVSLSEVAELVVQSLNLQNFKPAVLNEQTILTQGGLELDSVDILELVVAVERTYGIRINSAEEGRQVFENLGTLLARINAQH